MNFGSAAMLSSAVACLAGCAVAAPNDSREGSESATAAMAAKPDQRVDWNQAIELLKSGRVTVVVQLHDLSVTLTTVDGGKFSTRQPAIDAILAAIDTHAPNAAAIVVATE